MPKWRIREEEVKPLLGNDYSVYHLEVSLPKTGFWQCRKDFHDFETAKKWLVLWLLEDKKN